MTFEVPVENLEFLIYKVCLHIRQVHNIPAGESVYPIFEKEHNLKVIHDDQDFLTHLQFRDETDYTMFMLKWS